MQPQPLKLREYRIHDRDALASIAAEATGEPYSPERVSYELGMPGIDTARDVVVCESNGRVIGYLALTIDDVGTARQGRMENRVTSGHQESATAGRELLLWAARRMQEESEESPRRITLVEMVKEHDRARGEFLEDAGFRAIRYYRIMRLENPESTRELPLPPELRYIHGPGHEGADEYVAMFNDTWVDHYGYVALTRERYLHDLDSDPEYNAPLDIVLADSNGQFIGFAFCRVDASDPPMGEVMAIGIRRGFRGRGLGRILLSHAIKCLQSTGATRIELTVDSENITGAVGLYESVGFKAISMKIRYQLGTEGVLRLATFDAC